MARKILLADDSVTAQNMGRKILTDAGYEVVTVNNGSAALKKVTEQHPDLIVLDVYMPGYSGLEVCQRLKENRETTRIPILLTVGKLEPFKPDEARRVRADAYVIKPFEASELLTALTKLEDKIVPQAASDTHKPGRFAQAIAAFEESNADTGEKFGDAESGWKNRLRFPGRKKKDEQEPEADAMPASQAQGAAPSATGAPTAVPELTVTPGLPADITPDEIAAITAAAAQLSGDSSLSAAAAAPASAEGVAQETSNAEHGTVAPEEKASVSEAPVIESKETKPKQDAAASQAEVGVTEDAPPVTFAPSTAEAAAEEPTVEATVASAEPSQPSVPEAAAESVPAEALQASQAPIDVAKEQGSQETEAAKQASSEADADVIAALQALTPISEAPAAPTDGQASAETVAAAAAMEIAQARGPRWIAESTTVEASEANTPLEAEMQKAFAAFAAADAGRVSLPAAAISGSYVVPAITSTGVTQGAEQRVSVEVEASSPVLETAIAAVAASGSPQVSVGSEPSARSSRSTESEPEHTVPAASAQTEASKQDDTGSSEAQADPLRAAVWANWSQIRESIIGTSSSGDQTAEAKSSEQKVTEPPKAEPESPSAPSAASAEATAAEAGAIASIVESVMAELRPKIVEEITKKLGREKK